jgi:hypothetical protein
LVVGARGDESITVVGKWDGGRRICGPAVSISELSSSILIRLRASRRPRVAGPGELDSTSFFLSKSLGIKVGAEGAGGGGGGGSKESSYIYPEIGLLAFLAAAFLLEN